MEVGVYEETDMKRGIAACTASEKVKGWIIRARDGWGGVGWGVKRRA